ncbi:sigma-70 family RNA polymerase sigma factor [Pseudoalteromonas luteoviolacea]|uniref:sigma-70 family RNA polymerase sigma factor n=1 Tax=Pseudoalteromonas luteoviolacea TaxID=43657 RepID=UPI001B3974A6|nr:sigma-70 family RNA polymerase sigma factor [Pseudoalteromonas luteoviolacea]MBQ4836056.1 sigma-70 family RNA polymerase sigma factor [Pseudoalteromonas luteoviolacea]
MIDSRQNIKQVRGELKVWGRYWALKEETQGYAKKSNVERIKECCLLGGIFSSDAHLYSHGADSISPPDHIAQITQDIEALSSSCRKALVGKYIKGMSPKEIAVWADEFSNKHSVEFWLARAERGLLV